MDIDTEAKVYTITQPTDGPQAGKSSSNAGRRALKNIKGFGSKALAASLGFWMIVLIIAIIGVIPLTELIVGSVHKNACPMNHRIPIYLIVSGAVGLTIVIVSILQTASEEGVCCLCLNVILGLFKFAWFITGSVWVFSAKPKVQFSNPDLLDTYCHSIVFNCAYVTIIITYAFMVLVCCGSGARRT